LDLHFTLLPSANIHCQFGLPVLLVFFVLGFVCLGIWNQADIFFCLDLSCPFFCFDEFVVDGFDGFELDCLFLAVLYLIGMGEICSMN
jgi:hypothetical protein